MLNIAETSPIFDLSKCKLSNTKTLTELKTKIDWAIFMRRVSDEMYPQAKKITLVMDNFKTHTIVAFYEAFEPVEAKRLADRYDFVFALWHGSWLNMAEIELHELNAQCSNRLIPTIEKMEKEVEAWQTHRNNVEAKINWRFTNKDARIKLKRLYPSLEV